jgi:hypothetical protein
MATLECIALRSFARLDAMARRVGCFVREATPTPPLNARSSEISSCSWQTRIVCLRASRVHVIYAA